MPNFSTPKLTPEQQDRVRLLIAALRSGKYRQTKFGLNMYIKKAKKRKFCCLGVACEVARLSGLELKTVRDNEEYADGQISYDGQAGVLPTSVQHWYGFDNHDPMVLLEDGTSTATATILNDFRGYKFGQIADAFERTYLNEA